MTRGRQPNPRSWLWRSPTNLSVTVLFLSVCLLFGLIAASFVHLTARARGDEYKSCVIQARALPANRHLVRAVGDIGALLQAGLKHPDPRVTPRVLARLEDLQAQAARYARIESKQPSSRRC